jgi:DNA-binding transcriptional LysR family regulator
MGPSSRPSERELGPSSHPIALDLRLVDAFVAVAEQRHFGRAAEALHATQSGVSQQVARLERQLGFALFDRRNRRVELTPAGEAFLGRISALRHQLEDIVDHSRRVAEGHAGRVRVGLSSSLTQSPCLRRLADFGDIHPDIEVNVTVRPGDELIGLLESWMLDAALTTLPAPADDWMAEQVDIEPMGLVVPSDHPLATRPSASFADIAEEPLLVVPRNHDWRTHDAIIAAYTRCRRPPNIVGYETAFPSVIARVTLREGLALLPLSYAPFVAPTLRIVPLRDPSLSKLPIHLVAPKSRNPELVRRLADWMHRPDSGHSDRLETSSK